MGYLIQMHHAGDGQGKRIPSSPCLPNVAMVGMPTRSIFMASHLTGRLQMDFMLCLHNSFTR